MLFYLIILFTVLPALELAVLIKVGTIIGVGYTILLLILTGAIGASLARMQGLGVLYRVQEDLSKGLLPSHELINGLMILTGGILLLTPGFITDILGFSLLIPWTRSLVKYILRKKFETMLKEGQVVTVTSSKNSPFGKPRDKYDDIDVN